MTDQAATSMTAGSSLSRPWPMTAEAARALAAEIDRVRQDIAALAGEGLEEGLANLPLVHSIRRLETLVDTERRAAVIQERACAAIGRRATVRHPDGEVVCYTIVYPGDGDPARDCASADSPLGSALLGAVPGSVATVAAPAGAWSVVVVAVD